MAGGVAAGDLGPGPAVAGPLVAGPAPRSLAQARGWYRGQVDVEEPVRAGKPGGKRRSLRTTNVRCAALLVAMLGGLLLYGLLSPAPGTTAPAGALTAASSNAAPPPVLPSGFAIDAGLRITNDRRATIGDGGLTPFFSRGVLVWEGGSIINGGSATDRQELTRQTRALLDHTCRSYKSTSGNRVVADMIAQAPERVDVRYDPSADANVCVVMAGGGDLAGGADPQAALDGLRTYCAARRAAGFQVVALTLLPRSTPEGFNQARATYNAMLREQWPAFADGLADVNADPRIGADGANLDPVYFLDQVHPTSAGYGLMAAAVAPVLEGLVWHSDACRVRFSNGGAAWTSWRPYAESRSWVLAAGDGVKTVSARYRDADGAESTVSARIMLDTTPPVTRARKAVVRRGKVAALRFNVVDARPGSATAAVTILVNDATGMNVLTVRCGARKVDVRQLARFTCHLPRGEYRYFVYATDAAGNPQSHVGSAGLEVR
jgi:lysophospholipase L1-like esterase